jgi:C4-dicarboxylate-specific signal transduction histidine kinase
MKNAAQAARATGRRGVVRTRQTENGATLRIDLQDSPAAAGSLTQFFAPSGTPYPGTSRLELAVCEGIVRRMRGKLIAQNLPEGGLSILANWPSGVN